MPVILRRAQIRRGVKGVDITVKSAEGMARCFAPTWEMVMNSKRGELSYADYATRYHAILAAAPEAAWNWLEAQQDRQGRVTLLCYCANGAFCHTHLCIRYATEKFPHRFMDEETAYTADAAGV